MNTALSRIQQLLNERQWTMYRLSKESGVPYSSLNSLFRKNNQPTISTLEKLCSALDITPSEFFTDQTFAGADIASFTSIEKKLILDYRTLSRPHQELLREILQLLIQQENEANDNRSAKSRTVSLNSHVL